MAGFDTDIELLLVSGGLRVWATSAAELPDDSFTEAFITLTEAGGKRSLRTHNRVRTPYQRPHMTVIGRAENAVDARAVAASAKAILTGIRNQTIGSAFYLEIDTEGELVDLGLDKAQRPRFSFTATALKTYS